MPNVWVVRADGGEYTDQVVKGGYTGIGWVELGDVSSAADPAELEKRYREAFPNEASPAVIGTQVGQVARFLFELAAGDYVITPEREMPYLRYGKVEPGLPYYVSSPGDGCRYQLRRSMAWATDRLSRTSFSVPLQNTLRSALTVFRVREPDEFLQAIGAAPRPADDQVVTTAAAIGPNQLVLERVLELSATEFEHLVGYLLAAMGFEQSEVTQPTADGGVDARGELTASNLARVKVHVQAKRYKLGSKVSPGTVRDLRGRIPVGERGALITTADFSPKAVEIASEAGFAPVGLINGEQLVDLLVQYWGEIDEEFRARLGLKPGLVPV